MGAREQLDDEAAFVFGAWREFLRPPLVMRGSDWADRFRQIAKGPERGPWRTDRTPYLREPMDCMDAEHPAQKVVMQFATQLGKTEVLYNAIFKRIHLAPMDMMIVQPTLQDAKDHSRQRFTPTAKLMPEVLARIADTRSRDEQNTWQTKEIASGAAALFFAGANSARSLASKPLGLIVCDEIDGYPQDVDGEGDPLALVWERMSNFASRKLLLCSTPTVKGVSRIESEYLASDRRRYWVPCPHCAEMQVLEWGKDEPWGLKWQQTAAGEDMPETAVYVCRHCGVGIDEHHKTEMLRNGDWRAENPGAQRGLVAGFHLSKLYSPLGWKSWAMLVEERIAAEKQHAAGNSVRIKTFTNTTLAETWEETGDAADEHALQQRAEDYTSCTVPVGGLTLTTGVDVQGNRWEIGVWAWGRGLESWRVDHHIIEGNPQSEDDWQQVADYLRRRYPQAWHGGTLASSSISIDANYQTQAVLNFVRQQRAAGLPIQAVRGENDPKKPIKCPGTPQDVTWQGRKWAHGVLLWGVGVKAAKDLLFGQLKIATPGPGYVHTSRDTPREWYEQLTAEQRITVQSARGAVEQWVKRRPRNEALDCRNYATHAAYMLGLEAYDDARWLQVENVTQPPDLKAADAAPPRRPAVARQPSQPERPRGREW